jgi:hypothetical protein
LPIDIIVAEHSIHSGDMAHTGWRTSSGYEL